MISLFLQPIRQLASVLLANESPQQIAWGVVIGMLIGLVPKENLIAMALTVALFSLRVNRAAGLLSATAFWWVGFASDSFTHRLGAKVLTIHDFRPAYAWLYDLPLGPWIGFNNTVVLGSLLMGVYLAYPVYLLTHLLLERFQAPIVRWLLRFQMTRLLLGVDLASRIARPLGMRGAS